MSRLKDALMTLLGKCTPEGTHPVGNNTDEILECMAAHYRPTVCFYGNVNDNYLYTDKDMTVKATRADVVNAVKRGVYVIKSDSLVHYTPQIARIIDGENHAILYIIPHGTDISWQPFYSSEWTG